MRLRASCYICGVAVQEAHIYIAVSMPCSSSSLHQLIRQLRPSQRVIIPASKTGKVRVFWQAPSFSTTVKMSSISGAGIGAGLYAVVSNPAQIGTQPEEAAEKRHHLKNGKGFTNPWDSYTEISPFVLMIKGFLW